MKKTLVTTLLVSGLLAGLCGCASNSSGDSTADAKPKPAKDHRPKEDRLKVGMTTDEVQAACGNPKDKAVLSDGAQVWTYSDTEKAFIPFYTLSGGKFHTLTVNFDTNGVVKNWSSSKTSAF